MSPFMIFRATMLAFGLTASQLRGTLTISSVARPRMVAMYLMRRLTNLSLPCIGREFGGRHHTTVLYAIRTVEQKRQTDLKTRDMVSAIEEQLRVLTRPPLEPAKETA